MKVMGIDPGETTGWAVCNITNNGGHKIKAHGEINGDELLEDGFEIEAPDAKYSQYRAQCLALMQVVNAEQPKVVIIEDFVLRQFTTMKAEGISPARIGAMLAVWLHEIMSHERGLTRLKVKWQTPSQIAVLTKARMDLLGLWIPGHPHACDAVRHCEIYRRGWSGLE